MTPKKIVNMSLSKNLIDKAKELIRYRKETGEHPQTFSGIVEMALRNYLKNQKKGA